MDGTKAAKVKGFGKSWPWNNHGLDGGYAYLLSSSVTSEDSQGSRKSVLQC